MKQRIIFFGSGSYTIPIIKVLKKHGLILAVTTEKENSFTQFLEKENVQFISSNLKQKEDIEKISDSNPTLGVLASYGAVISEEVLSLFPLGILNIHPSLLPKYKGPSPIQATILSGEKETGVTVIKLDEQVDHGHIVAQAKMKVEGNETTDTLKDVIFTKGAKMISSIIRIVEKGKQLTYTKQDHSKEVFTQKITREDGYININTPPDPITLDHMIRAYHPWPGVWLQYQISKIKHQTSIIKLLPNQKIQVEGGKPMSYKDFINGYQKPARRLLEALKLLPAS